MLMQKQNSTLSTKGIFVRKVHVIKKWPTNDLTVMHFLLDISIMYDIQYFSMKQSACGIISWWKYQAKVFVPGMRL
jgi:hypothetical protein